MTAQCCCCQKIRGSTGWKSPGKGDIAPDTVSHTYCPACYAELRTELKQWKKRLARKRLSS
jgi:hypothetical protein